MAAGNYMHATDQDVRDLKDKGVPGEVARALIDYVNDGHEPDSFLRAVLANDLGEACAWAPVEVGPWLKAMVTWIYMRVPSNAWHTREKVAAWCRMGGANGA